MNSHAPTIVLPTIQIEGNIAMQRGRALSSAATPDGLTFCPYPIGSTERANFLEGCRYAAFSALQFH